MSSLSLHGVTQVPLIEPGDDLPEILAAALRDGGLRPAENDILVVCQKIVSKAEGRYVLLGEVAPGPRAQELAELTEKDPRLVELVLRESSEVLRAVKGRLIVVHRLGFVVANAGIDQSNIRQVPGEEQALLLPEDPDASAARLRAGLRERLGLNLGIVINDSFGRAWRNGIVGTAIGTAGLPALQDLVGAPDLFGRPLEITQSAFADEIASAASLLMGQADQFVPAVLLSGLAYEAREDSASALIRPKSQDLFR
ncbi:MAG: coenzyme F420-0:L-glutamate ligase [Rhodovibrionaceae bacterium]